MSSLSQRDQERRELLDAGYKHSFVNGIDVYENPKFKLWMLPTHWEAVYGVYGGEGDTPAAARQAAFKLYKDVKRAAGKFPGRD